jgi:hypothetical protein
MRYHTDAKRRRHARDITRTQRGDATRASETRRMRLTHGPHARADAPPPPRRNPRRANRRAERRRMISRATTVAIAPNARAQTHARQRRAPSVRASTSAPTLGGRRSAIVGGGAVALDKRAMATRAERRRVVTCVKTKRCARERGRTRRKRRRANAGGGGMNERARERERVCRRRERERGREGETRCGRDAVPEGAKERG